MKLVSLSIQAFGPYLASQSISFDQAHEQGLFLVQGPTGSGKSSILDALCFCLYGIPSGDKRDLLELRCHLAPEETRTEVELEFMIGGLDYRARRSYTSKKGQVHDHQCMMEILESGTWRALYTKLSQAQEVVASILGLKADQFRQVILLPQGKFRDFLVASSQERTDILKTLFNTQDLDRFMEILQERVSGLKEAAREKSGRIQALYQAMGMENSTELAAVMETTSIRLKDAGTRLASLRTSAAQARTRLEKARETALLDQELGQVRTVLGELEATRTAQEDSVRQLGRARKVAPLTARGSEVRNRRQEQAALETRLATSVQAGKAAEKNLAALDSRQEEMKSLATSIQSMKTSLQALTELQGLAGIGKEKHLALERGQRSLQEVLSGLDGAHARLSGLEKEWAPLAPDQALEACNPGTLRDLGRELQAISAQGLELRTAQVAETRRRLKLKESLDALSIKKVGLEKSMAAISALRKEHESRLAQSQALALRASLVAGTPCPVCGSPDHPVSRLDENAPHSNTEIDYLILDLKNCQEQEASLARDLQELKIQTAQLETQAEDSGQKISDLENRSGVYRNSWDGCLDSFAAVLAKASGSPGHATMLDEASRSRKAAEAFSPDLAEKLVSIAREIAARHEALTEQRKNLTLEIESLKLEIASMARREAEIRADLARTDGEASALGSRIQSLCMDQGLKGLLDGLALPWHLDAERVQAETQDLRRKLENHEAALARHETDLALSRLALTHEQANTRDLEHSLRQHQAMTEELESRWLEDLGKAGFAGLEDARKAWLSDEAMENLESGIKSWQDKFQASSHRREILEARLEGAENEDPLELEKLHDSLNAELESALKEEGSNAALLARMESARQEEVRLSLEFRESEEKLALTDGLFRLLNGQDNHLRINLERYALSVYLDEVLEEANLHLDRMSRGRYALQRQDEGQDRRRSAGLEIGIMDAYTARFRSCASLSGGESFMAALALALGLSATVHRRSGGVRLDTLLIDEGFGSLDEEALQDAMSVLSVLKEKGQVVGIISHVRELQERISCQLLVKRSNGGSSIAWAR